MLADSLLPITFWAEEVNTACYVLNRDLVTKSHNKTPYELLNGRTPKLDFMRPFGCPFTILNTVDPLGKFKGKADEGFLVGYSVTSKAFRIFNTKTRKSEENLHSSDDKVADDKPKDDTGSKSIEEPINKEYQANIDELGRLMSQEKEVSDATDALKKDAGEPSSPNPDAFIPANTLLHVDQDDSQIPNLEDTVELRSTGIFTSAYGDDLDIFTSG
nr:retrovirus-related Pol polyprotein from transposon TNT 1-94 [Tanacetum cinerariifolium]